MASLVGSADIYITPYCHEAQAVSGTLAYAMGAGKAIISTPYWHAVELLNNDRGVLVPFENPAAIAVTAIQLLDDDAERQLYARARIPLRTQDGLEPGGAVLYALLFPGSTPSRCSQWHLGVPSRAPEKIASSRFVSV